MTAASLVGWPKLVRSFFFCNSTHPFGQPYVLLGCEGVNAMICSCRCSESAVMALRGGKAPHPVCPCPSASRLVPNSPTSERAAPSRLVRQALERALLITHRQFWDKYMPERKDMGKADTTRRKVIAMQFYLRLYILVVFQGALTSTACFVCWYGRVNAVPFANDVTHQW